MGAKTYEKLREKYRKELEEIANKDGMSAGDLEMSHKLTDSIKNTYKIECLEEELGYSGGGDWSAEGRYSNSRGNGRAGTHYVNGYYSHDGNQSGGRYKRDRYSMDDGREMFGRQMRGMMSNDSYDPMERERMSAAYDRMY